MGYKIPLGNVREYIENYSFKELMCCLARIEKIVSYVIERTFNSLSYMLVGADYEGRYELFLEDQCGME